MKTIGLGIAMLIGFSVLHRGKLVGQVSQNDRAGLVTILLGNCRNCPLQHQNSQSYWNVNGDDPADFPGVTVRDGHIIGLELNDLQLKGTLHLDQFDSLRYAYFSGNQLDSLAPGFSGNLETLKLSSNELSSFPSPTNFPKLRNLYLDSNQIASLPSFREAHSLNHFQAIANQLESLPDFKPCSKGKHSLLSFTNNPLKSIGSLVPCQVQMLFVGNTQLTFAQLEPFVDNSLWLFLYRSAFASYPISEDSSYFNLFGDPVVLDASSIGGPRGIYKWVHDGDTIAGRADPKLTITEQDPKGWYSCVVRHPAFFRSVENPLITTPVFAEFDPGISRKDPNRDGRPSIFDIIGVGMRYGEQGLSREYNARYFNQDRQPSRDWVDADGKPRVHIYNGDTINLKHFDSNGDGIIDELDLEYFKAEMQQIDWRIETLHIDQKTLDIPLVAEVDTNNIIKDENGYYWIRYKIRIGDLNQDMEGKRIRGLIFVRPEVETEEKGFNIDTMQADFDDSQFAPDPNNQVKVAKFYKNSQLDLSGFTPSECIKNVVRPLEVAFFRKDTAIPIWSGQRIVDCLVGGTIDDLVPFGKAVPLLFETTNIILFEELGPGNWQRFGGVCTVDPSSARIRNDYQCNSTLVRTEIKRKPGSDSIYFDYELSSPGTVEIVIKDKNEGEVATHRSQGEWGTYKLNTVGLEKGKYTATFRSCDGKECEGEFAIRRRSCERIYYSIIQSQPSCR